jgi:hypothetical protein
MTAPEHDVDALRAKLKTLGYLDAGVDRFVLAPAKAGRSVWQIALRASLRIGILAGLLLGLSGALAAGARVPGLLAGLRDTVVFASMLAVVFGFAVFLVAFTSIALAARAVRWLGARTGVARRARPLALGAGVIVGAGCLAYLTLWWRATGDAGGSAAWWVTTAALLTAVIISLLLGHATTLTAQAVMANELPDAATTPRRRLSLRASAGMALGGVALAASVLALAPERQGDVTPPRLTVVPTGARLVVFAIDGYEQGLADRYRPELVPSANQLWFVGGHRLPRQSADPAREWMTIATGHPAERHGVTALEVRRLAGLEGQLPPVAAASSLVSALGAATDLLRLTRPEINTGVVRREKTFWEVAAQGGLRTVAVNWWTSWPARDEDGVVLSERAVLRLDRGGDLNGEIVPASLYADLRERWPALARQAAELADTALLPVRRNPGPPGEPSGAPAGWPGPVAGALREAALVDAQQLVLFGAVTNADVDLATVYLPGLDILGTKLRALGDGQASTATLVGSADAVQRYYEWLAAGLALAVRRTSRTEAVLIGHPGRAGNQGDAVLAWEQGPAASAPAKEPRRGLAGAGALLDVAPTMLRVLGVPLSDELQGAALWPPAFTRRASPGDGVAGGPVPIPPTVTTYGRRGAGLARAAGPDSLDEEMRDRLRSLGYVR